MSVLRMLRRIEQLLERIAVALESQQPAVIHLEQKPLSDAEAERLREELRRRYPR